MPILTKDALLKGVKQTIEFELRTIKGSVLLRPLSQAEVENYNKITAKAMGTFETNEKAKRGFRKQTSSDVTSVGKINFEKNTEAHAKAQRYAVATSMTCNDEEYSEDEVGQFTGDLFNEIFDKVCEISGIDVESTEDDVEEFPEDS
mgnify:CR=1 FL=1